MGLDTVEIVLKIERVFHLHLDELFWQRLIEIDQASSPGERQLCINRLTVGTLHDEIIRRLQVVGWYESVPSLEQTQAKLLARLRAHYQRDDITLETPIHSVLTIKPLYEDWKEFTELVQVPLPELIVPGRQFHRRSGLLPIHDGHGCFGAFILGGVLGLAAIWWLDNPWIGLAIGCGFTPFVMYSLDKLRYQKSLDPKSRKIPTEIETVGRLAEYIHRTGANQATGGPWNEQSVWDALQNILSETLSIPREKVVREAHLIKDLGMD